MSFLALLPRSSREKAWISVRKALKSRLLGLGGVSLDPFFWGVGLGLTRGVAVCACACIVLLTFCRFVLHVLLDVLCFCLGFGGVVGGVGSLEVIIYRQYFCGVTLKPSKLLSLQMKFEFPRSVRVSPQVPRNSLATRSMKIAR